MCVTCIKNKKRHLIQVMFFDCDTRIFTYMFRPVIRPSSGWYFCYKNAVWLNVSNLTIIKLKTAGLPAETCRWEYHNNSTSVELSAFCCFLVHIVRTINLITKLWKNISKRFIPLHRYYFLHHEPIFCDRHNIGNTRYDILSKIQYFHDGGVLEYSPLVNDAIVAIILSSK